MQNSHQLLTYLYYVSGTCPGRELSEIPADYAYSARFTHIVHEPCKIHQSLTYLYYVSGTCPGRELSGIQVDYADSMQFAHIVHESHEIRTICYVSDAGPVAENSLKFQRIKQNSLNPPTYPANYVNSAHFAVN